MIFSPQEVTQKLLQLEAVVGASPGMVPSTTAEVLASNPPSGVVRQWGNGIFDVQAPQNPTPTKGDGNRVFDGAITSGQAVLSSASILVGMAKPPLVGHQCSVVNAGASGAALITTILAVNLAGGTITLNANASNTVTGAQVDWGSDEWAAINAAITAAQNAKGGRVVLSTTLTGPSIYNTTKTLLIGQQASTVSDITLEVQDGAEIHFIPTAPYVGGVNDRAIWINSTFSARRQIAAGAIAIGATAFTAQNAGDTSDLLPGDWLVIRELDLALGEGVLTDWMQVRSVAGTTVNVVGGFRTAYPNARAWQASPASGLGFQRITGLVQRTKLINPRVTQPKAGQTNPSIGIGMSLDTLVEHPIVDNPSGQPLYSYIGKEVTIRNPFILGTGGTSASEIAATVDLRLEFGSASAIASANGNLIQAGTSGWVLDLGTAFFDIIGGAVQQAGNIGIQLTACHDGVWLNPKVGWVRNAGQAGQGIVMLGCQRVKVALPILNGGEGGTVGISIGDTSGYTVNLNSDANVILFPSIAGFATLTSLTGSLATDTVVGSSAGAVWANALDAWSNGGTLNIGTVRAGGINLGYSGMALLTLFANSVQGVGNVWKLLNNGTISAVNELYPGTPAGAYQTACGLLAGTGVPSNAQGNNGDIYFRSDGGASTTIYQKRAGSWVATAA